MKFRKKPVVVEAKQFPDDGPGQSDIANWVKEFKGKLNLYDGNVENNVKTKTEANWRWNHGFIETLEGNMVIGIGDWVVKGIENEFYPVRKDIFEKTYEPV